MVTINKGSNKITTINPNNPPISVSLTASYPRPSNNNECPGKTAKTVDSSGAPRKIEGIAFVKVCKIDIAIIKTLIAVADVSDNKKAELEIISMLTRLM